MGRKATGRTTRIVRVPLDMDIDVAVALFYDVLPLIQLAMSNRSESPRHYHLNKFLGHLYGVLPDDGLTCVDRFDHLPASGQEHDGNSLGGGSENSTGL